MGEDLWVIESGAKRSAIKSICDNCHKEFLQRASRSRKRKYCSKTCSYIGKENKISVFCYTCNKEIKRAPSKLKKAVHGIYFCCRKCKEVAQSLIGNCPDIRPYHYGTGTGKDSYRELMKDEIKKGCIGCLIKEPYLLSVHHIDGNRLHNVKLNLEVVCYNCHTKRHLYLNNNQWVFRSNMLTPRDMIDKL